MRVYTLMCHKLLVLFLDRVMQEQFHQTLQYIFSHGDHDGMLASGNNVTDLQDSFQSIPPTMSLQISYHMNQRIILNAANAS